MTQPSDDTMRLGTIRQKILGMGARTISHDTGSELLERLRDMQDAQNEARDASDRFRQLIESLADALFIHDFDGRLVEVNMRACQQLGYPRDRLLGLAISDIEVHWSQEACARVWESVREGRTVTIEGVHQRADGSTFPVELRLCLFRWRGQDLVLALSRDIEARVLDDQARDLQEAHHRQQQRLHALGMLAGGVAHEINNPINGIINYAQLIIDRCDTGDPMADYAAEILSETQRVAGVIKSLLTFARADHAEATVVRVATLLDGTLCLVQTSFRNAGIRLTLSVPDGLPSLHCHGRQIRQVVMNLLVNAFDALTGEACAAQRDPRVDIKACTFERDGAPWVRLSVLDNGPGIPPELQDSVFDPFFTTGDRSVKHGLGLATAYSIAREHGGTLWFETEPGERTSFHLELPVRNDGQRSEEGRESSS